MCCQLPITKFLKFLGHADLVKQDGLNEKLNLALREYSAMLNAKDALHSLPDPIDCPSCAQRTFEKQPIPSTNMDGQNLPRLSRLSPSFDNEVDIMPRSLLLSPVATTTLHALVSTRMSSEDPHDTADIGCGERRNFAAGQSLHGKSHPLYDTRGTFSMSCGEGFVLSAVSTDKSESFVHPSMLLLHLFTLIHSVHVLFYDIACRIKPFFSRFFGDSMKRVGFFGEFFCFCVLDC